ncbi:MAG: hypothetical protein OEM26_04570 [Saprospiraceae bacterium]|nr:hypothetical protein [Saprospiraceae bacterium]
MSSLPGRQAGVILTNNKQEAAPRDDMGTMDFNPWCLRDLIEMEIRRIAR